MSDKQRTHFYLEARDAGSELVVIDIAYRTMASKADWFVPVHPATDGALALGVVREILEQSWEATDFLRDHTEAPFLIKEDGMFLRMSDLGVEPTTTTNAQGQEEKVDPCVVWDEESRRGRCSQRSQEACYGRRSRDCRACRENGDGDDREAVAPWTLEHTSEVTGVSADDIKHLAHLYTQEGNVQTDMKFGLNHYNNGIYSSKCVNTLLLVAGQIGQAGSGLYTGEPNFGEGNVQACLQLPSTTGEVPQEWVP